MTEACGVTFAEARTGIEMMKLEGVDIPFANATLMLKMKQSWRAKDTEDRSFLQELLRNTPPPAAPLPPG